MLTYTQCHRFQALDEHECIERRHGGSKIPQKRHACLDDVCDGTEWLDGFGPHGAVITRVRCIEHGEAVGVLFPIETPTVNDDSADRCAVPANEFRCGMYADGGPVIDGPAQDWRRRVIYDQRHAKIVADLRYFRDREYPKLRIR